MDLRRCFIWAVGRPLPVIQHFIFRPGLWIKGLLCIVLPTSGHSSLSAVAAGKLAVGSLFEYGNVFRLVISIYLLALMIPDDSRISGQLST